MKKKTIEFGQVRQKFGTKKFKVEIGTSIDGQVFRWINPNRSTII